MDRANDKSINTTLQTCRQSTRKTRRAARRTRVQALTNVYQARLVDTKEMMVCCEPPAEGFCYEWVYLDSRGIPCLYWSSDTASVMLI